MPSRLTHLRVKNFRSLADVSCDLTSLNVIFGPNGAGKSSLLDAIWFVRDCAMHGVGRASSSRSHGIGMLWDGAEQDARIAIDLGTDSLAYELELGFSAGRIEPLLGEMLIHRSDRRTLISRSVGSSQAEFLDTATGTTEHKSLREPSKPSLGRYLDFIATETGADRDSPRDSIERSVEQLDQHRANRAELCLCQRL